MYYYASIPYPSKTCCHGNGRPGMGCVGGSFGCFGCLPCAFIHTYYHSIGGVNRGVNNVLKDGLGARMTPFMCPCMCGKH